jgi:hypothetical protein
MDILHYLGMRNDFKGIFIETSVEDAIRFISNAGIDYKLINESLQRSIRNKSIGVFDSWEIISDTVAIKLLTNQCLNIMEQGYQKKQEVFG